MYFSLELKKQYHHFLLILTITKVMSNDEVMRSFLKSYQDPSILCLNGFLRDLKFMLLSPKSKDEDRSVVPYDRNAGL